MRGEEKIKRRKNSEKEIRIELIEIKADKVIH